MKLLTPFLVAIGLAAMIGASGPAAAHEPHFPGPYPHHWHRGPHAGFFFGEGHPFVYRDWPPPPPIVIYREAPPPAVAEAAPPVHAVPTSPDYTDSRGRTCREFHTTVTIGGKPQPSYGTACQEADGSWHIVP